MTVRVRFAPSPTGYLHIGGLRTAIYNYLYAKANNGVFVLRIEDTDQERSTKESEAAVLDDLKWAGIEWDEGPGIEGDFGPYRQSDRTAIYKKYADQLIETGKAFYCFCTDEELEEMREKALAENRSTHYAGPYRDYPLEKAKERIANGEKPVIRFKAPKRSYILNDEVKGKVEFPEDMIGDFVIMRGNGLPVYNFCCVVDDALMKMTHIFRGEDHLNNTLRQLMIYEALGFEIPKFGHVSLLIGEDRQKLSKRHGATSVNNYREDNYLADALNNYLCLLGWSHPEEKDVFTLKEIESIFDSSRFSKSSAIYDMEKLKYINGAHIKNKSNDIVLKEAQEFIPKDSPFHLQEETWKMSFIELFKTKISFYKDLSIHCDLIFKTQKSSGPEVDEIQSWQTTNQIKDFLEQRLKDLSSEGKKFASADDFQFWVKEIKTELKIKGKQLFKGIRLVLTGDPEGPDLKEFIPLTPISVISERLKNI